MPVKYPELAHTTDLYRGIKSDDRQSRVRTVQIKLSEDEHANIKAVARHKRVSMGCLVRMCIENYVGRL